MPSDIEKLTQYKSRLDQLKEKLIQLRVKHDQTKDERDEILAALDAKFDIKSREQLQERIQEQTKTVQDLNEQAEQALNAIGTD